MTEFGQLRQRVKDQDKAYKALGDLRQVDLLRERQLKEQIESQGKKIAALSDALKPDTPVVTEEGIHQLLSNTEAEAEQWVRKDEVQRYVMEAIGGLKKEMVPAAELEKARLEGACQLLIRIGWSTGHGDTFDDVVEETLRNKAELVPAAELEEQAKAMEEAAWIQREYVEKLEQQLEALHNWLRHGDNCNRLTPGNSEDDPCTCGLDEALSKLSKAGSE